MSSEVSQIISVLKEKDEEAAEQDVALEKFKEERRQLFEKMAELIKDGKDTTKDRFLDFIICAFKTFDYSYVEGLKSIEEMLRGYLGEPILVVCRKYSEGRLSSGLGGGIEKRFEENMFFWGSQ